MTMSVLMSRFVVRWLALLQAPAVPVSWAVFSLLGIVAGPFGTLEGLSGPQRLLFWPVVIGAGIVLCAGLRVVVVEVFGLRGDLVGAPVLAVLAAVVMTPPLYAATVQFLPESQAMRLHWVELGGLVFLCSISVSAMRYALAQQPRGAAANPTPASPAPAEVAPHSAAPRLMARLDPALRAPLIRLSVRDHYVDVVTGAGQASLLMRFADALAELDGVCGLRVHRSHWVALDAVSRAERRAGKVQVRLCDGSAVPVSRPYQPDLIERGLLTPAQRGIGSASARGPVSTASASGRISRASAGSDDSNPPV